MYRFVGWQIFEVFNQYTEAINTKNQVRFDILDSELTVLVRKYDMIKQILIER